MEKPILKQLGDKIFNLPPNVEEHAHPLVAKL